jgi:mannan endo-1,4-beta-mannosidase
METINQPSPVRDRIRNCEAITFVMLALLAFCFQANAQMYLNGRHLYTQNNEKVILRGVNEMFIWAGDKSGWNIYPEIEKTGANCVRIAWNTTGSVTDLKNTIYNCVTRGKSIAMVTLMDATGDFSKLQTCLDYWKRADVKKAIQDFKKWTILNIANEAGNSVDDATFKSKYKDAIAQLRNAGYTVPLVIDASGYGQDFDQIKRTWSEIFNSDPQRKTLFSVHLYWTTGGNARINNMANDVKNGGIPFIIGEGPEQVGWDCNTTADYRYAMQRFQENEIGWMAWSWGAVQNGNCSSGRKFDMTTNGYYGNWVSDWGRDVAFYNAYSIKNTSRRPASLTAPNPFSRTAALQTLLQEEEPQDESNAVEVYPNPVHAKEIEVIVRQEELIPASISLVDLSGKKATPDFKATQKQSSVAIPVVHLSKGLYVLKVEGNNNQTITRKVIIQ